MNYKNIRKAVFLTRPNRFIAHILLEGKEEICHVKNTGRCQELLTPGAEIYVQEIDEIKRKTKYDLISVYKGQRLVNIDSQAPNKLFREWAEKRQFFGEDAIIRSEYTYGQSRFDFYVESGARKILVEIKGVTLEEHMMALFPDAPTQRGVKHIQELQQALVNGMEAYLVFIIQMQGVHFISPNWRTHPAFGYALIQAEKAGLKIMALDCQLGEDWIEAREFVEVRLGNSNLNHRS